jgi:hypothetical protein
VVIKNQRFKKSALITKPHKILNGLPDLNKPQQQVFILKLNLVKIRLKRRFDLSNQFLFVFNDPAN